MASILVFQFWAALAAAACLLAGCSSTQLSMESPFFRPQSKVPEHVVLKTVGPDGQSFTAKLKIDGHEREISGVSPAEYPLDAVLILGEIRKTGGTGTLWFEITRTNGMCSFGGLDLPGSHLKFGYHHGGIEFRQLTFHRNSEK